MVEECTGCLGCIDICKVGALDVETMEDGFIYPKIDKDKCVECGKCISVCSFKNPIKKLYPQDTYIAISSDVTNTINSTSGGIFWELANAIISNGGYVCGCVLDQELNPVHIISNKIEDIVSMQGSKYIQSDMSTIYPQINKICQEKKDILFTGTPCQCSAIKLHFPNYEHLYLVDIVCHGVPSSALWKKNLNELNITKSNGKMQFRIKGKYDRTRYAISINNKIIDYKKNGYYTLFMKERSFRKSCYQCQFAEDKRVGDITIGDCNTWGDYANFYPDKPISILLVNSFKGEALFNMIKDNIEYENLDFEKEKKCNRQLSVPSDIKKRVHDYELYDITFGEKKLSDYSEGYKLVDYFKYIIKRILPVKLRHNIQGIIK